MTAPTPPPAPAAASSSATALKVALGALVVAGIALAVLLGLKLTDDEDTETGAGGETFSSAPDGPDTTDRSDAADDPDATTAEETSTTTATPKGPTEIILRAYRMEISQGGGDVVTYVDYTKPADEAIDHLTDALGAPTRTLQDPGDAYCFPPSEIVEWPGLSLQHTTTPDAPDGFRILSGDADAEEQVTTAVGTHVGDSLDSVLAAAPEALTSTYSYEGTDYTTVLVEAAQIYDRGPAEDPNGDGVIVYTQNGVVTGITAPMYLIDEC